MLDHESGDCGITCGSCGLSADQLCHGEIPGILPNHDLLCRPRCGRRLVLVQHRWRCDALDALGRAHSPGELTGMHSASGQKYTAGMAAPHSIPFAGLFCLLVLHVAGLLGCQDTGTVNSGGDPAKLVVPSSFDGSQAGDQREIVGVKVCWCPAGKFTMGSQRSEPERRPGEDQVEVTLTQGFWMAKFEATQGDWKRVIGTLPGDLTAELPAGDDLPVGNVNFTEAEAFCRKLTELGHESGGLPEDWEFRLPTEAQWEYACRSGTTTATAF